MEKFAVLVVDSVAIAHSERAAARMANAPDQAFLPFGTSARTMLAVLKAVDGVGAHAIAA
jgi:hypothetical protein